MKASAARRFASEKALAEELAAKLEPVELEFTRKSSEAGHLFAPSPRLTSPRRSTPRALRSTAARFTWTSRSRAGRL